MSWQQIKVNVDAQDAETVGDFLIENNAQAVTFVDAKDTPIFEPKPGEILLWPSTQVIGLYPAQADMTDLIDNLASMPCFNTSFHYALDQLEDKDWEREWMDNFHPMQFGERLWICPSWREIPEPDAINIMLDPGLAFGTGTHPTTSLCLKWLDAQDLEQKSIVDFGCGSGILALAALLLGAKHAVGIDIDPQALLASRQNAEKNAVEARLSLYLPPEQPAVEVDIVMANILAGPIKELHQVITDFCLPGGKLMLSGILDCQAEEVLAVYQDNFDFDPVAVEGEWVRLTGTKR